MNTSSFGEIRSFILNLLAGPFEAKRLTPQNIPDDFDLLIEGVIDSLGIVELISAIEDQFRISIDFEELDADDLTVIGPLCRYIDKQLCMPAKLRA
jgi:acyl carrier protein